MRFYQQWTACGKAPDTDKFGESFSATVPGNVQWDYAVAHGMENFTFNDGVTAFDAIEEYTWRYDTTLSFQANKDEKAVFVAEGVDYRFDVLLDDVCLLSHEGMYTKVEIDITDKVKSNSVLSVLIYPHPKSCVGRKNTRDEANRSCKPPVTYGWDWNPRLIISGMWKPAYIETRKPAHITACEPLYTLSDDLKTAAVRFETVCDGDVLYTVYDPDNKVVYEGYKPTFTLENVRLWWCNGQGTPDLYRWVAKSADDTKEGHIGFRTVRLVHNEGADMVPHFPKGRYPCPITIELNGRRIFAKGSNWVNPDLFFGRITEERYETLITLAKDANMNIFRCWGGAGINKEAFYEQCDKNGIMVWQEFMLACNKYVGEPHYMEVLEQEATAILKALRRYPSVVLWCGGNELFNAWSGMDDQSLPLRLLDKLCYEYDRDTPFLMTSPVFGMGHGGYVFRGFRDKLDVMQKFNNSHYTAYTEFGVPSITPPELLKTIIPADELFPINDTPAWRTHHGFGAWAGDTWVCHSILNHYFGEDNSLEERVYHSNWLQCTGYKAIFEEARRQWGYCSMAINWCYNEPWVTAANNSLLNYPAQPKPAYYAVKEALRPVLASARIPKFDWKGEETFTAELWYLNDSPAMVSDTVQVSIKIGDTEIFLLEWQTGEVAANTNKLGPAVNFKLPMSADTNMIELFLRTAENKDSTYRLLFKNGKKPVYTGMLNE